MKRRLIEKQDSKTFLVNDFGKQKLIMYADSFRNLANTYKDSDSGMDEAESRQEYIVKQKLYENREVLADHIKELADVLNIVADENITIRKLTGNQEKLLWQMLKRNKLMMENFCFSGNEADCLEVSVRLKYVGKGNFSTNKAAKILSLVLGYEFIQKESSPLYVMDEGLIRDNCKDYYKYFKCDDTDNRVAFAGKAFLTVCPLCK